MKRTEISLFTAFAISLCVAAFFGGCASDTTKHSTSVVDYLFPDTNNPVVTPSIPVLTLPLHVGVAFVPGGGAQGGRVFRNDFSIPHGDELALTEKRKMDLMQEAANHFKKYPFVKEIEIIPSTYLRPGGSFANLDQIRTMYGVDVIALLSYDQVQFTDQGNLSLTYWTIVGAYVIPGQKNDTDTMLDAVVYDIPSRKMLFRAPGLSNIKGSATPVNLSEELRADSDKGFSEAAKEMIKNLDDQLTLFKEKVKERPQEYRVIPSRGYAGENTGERTGGGSTDLISLVLLAGLGGYFLWMQKRT